jgi:hypothetical protein
MKADIPALPSPSEALAPGRGAPIVAGAPLSVYAPLEDSLLYLYALIVGAGSLGALLAAEWRLFGLALKL